MFSQTWWVDYLVLHTTAHQMSCDFSRFNASRVKCAPFPILPRRMFHMRAWSRDLTELAARSIEPWRGLLLWQANVSEVRGFLTALVPWSGKAALSSACQSLYISQDSQISKNGGGRRPELSDLMSLSQKLRPSWRRLPQILISAPFSSSPDPYPPTLRDNHIRFKGLFDIGRMDCFRQSCQFRSRAFSSSIRR